MCILYSLTLLLSTTKWRATQDSNLQQLVSKTRTLSFELMAHIWSGVEESNLYSHFRRMLSYPLNERQLTLLYYLLVLKSRIELEIHPYQGCVMPFNYKSLVPRVRLELTFKFLLLRETTFPICLSGHLVRRKGIEPLSVPCKGTALPLDERRMVQPLGIEPSSMALHATAMTTSAKVALEITNTL